MRKGSATSPFGVGGGGIGGGSSGNAAKLRSVEIGASVVVVAVRH
jgi:hypothetical protein